MLSLQNETKICMLSFTTRIILLFLAFHVIVETIAACIMLKKRDKSDDRARKCITVFFITSAIASLVEIFLVIVDPLGPNVYRLIDTKVILCGFLIFALYFTLSVLCCFSISPLNLFSSLSSS